MLCDYVVKVASGALGHPISFIFVSTLKKICFFFLWRRASQQMLRTHRSLEAYCATLWLRWSNGALVEWKWQGKPVPVPLCPPQIPHGLTWDRTRFSAVRGRRLTAWAMARPRKKKGVTFLQNSVTTYLNKWSHVLNLLSTQQEMIPSLNATNAQAQDSVVTNELLLPILKAFAHYPRSLKATRNARYFQSVCTSGTVCSS
jgi:hypothetical protein